jgi:hypothetical protein
MEKRKLRGLMFSLQRIKRKEKIAARKRRREQNK